MKISRDYSILLKSYQLKDFLSSKGISFNTDECKLILESGFCQSLSRDIRKKIKKEINEKGNEIIDVTLLSITHRMLISEFDRFQRKIKLSEYFDTADLIKSINIVQNIVEYLCSLLLIREDNYLRKDIYPHGDELKNELISLTLLCDAEDVFFTEHLLDEHFSSELKYIKIPGYRTMRDLNKLLLWSQNLVDLVNEYMLSVTIPNDLITFSSLMGQFVKEQREGLLDEIKNQFQSVVRSLYSILLHVITSFNEKTEEKDFLSILFKIFEFSAYIASMAMEEIISFLDGNEFLHLITAVQLLSISRIYGTLKLDERRFRFVLCHTELIYENVSEFYFNGASLEKSAKIIEDILNDLYLEQENCNSLMAKTLEYYEILNNEIRKPLSRGDVFRFIKCLLYCNNITFYDGKF